MIRRTKGRLLISLLVITGLAGTLKDSAISKNERKSSISILKDTKSDLYKSVKGLSSAQLNFHAAPNHWSIKECVYHIAISEKNLWDLLTATINAPANPEKRAEIKVTDEALIKMMEDRNFKVKTAEPFETKKTPYKSLDEAIESFKTGRADHINYMKTTTEDMRNHVAQMPLGWIDCYQLCLMMASQSNRYTQLINEVKKAPNYPKK